MKDIWQLDKELKIALDIDDVLAGFTLGVFETFGKNIVPHDHWDENDLTGKLIIETTSPFSYKKVFLDNCDQNPDFWLDLQPISLPVHFKDLNVVCYITSSPRKMVNYRILWLKKHGFPTLPVIHSSNKRITMKQLGVDVLVDDNLSTIEQIKATEGLTAIHFKPWYSTVKTDSSITNLNQITYGT